MKSVGSARAAWLPIESAPKDGTEILAWRWDCGTLLIRWTCGEDFMTTGECEAYIREHGGEAGADLESYGWFCADFVAGSRLEGSEVPTLWHPLPDEPDDAQRRQK